MTFNTLSTVTGALAFPKGLPVSNPSPSAFINATTSSIFGLHGMHAHTQTRMDALAHHLHTNTHADTHAYTIPCAHIYNPYPAAGLRTYRVSSRNTSTRSPSMNPLDLPWGSSRGVGMRVGLLHERQRAWLRPPIPRTTLHTYTGSIGHARIRNRSAIGGGTMHTSLTVASQTELELSIKTMISAL